MLILDWFKKKLEVEAPWIAFSEPLAAYEREILRGLAKERGRDFGLVEVGAEGPDADFEGSFSSLDFFSTAKIFFVHLKGNPVKWSDGGKRRWAKLIEQSTAEGNWLMVSADQLSFLKGAPLGIANGTSCLNFGAWLQYFNETLAANLSIEQLKFLLERGNQDVLELKHWVELWGLGGDDWAAHALGWGAPKTAITHSAANANTNLSYQWVDAALAGNKSLFLRLTETLLEQEGEDPLRLLALLGKSVKIISQLALGEEPAGEPPFLITKLKRLKFKPELLQWWCQCDLAMKSTRADVKGLFVQMPA